MKTIYLNKDFQCSVTEKSDTVQSIETDAFDGKCNAYVEGYRFILEGRPTECGTTHEATSGMSS